MFFGAIDIGIIKTKVAICNEKGQIIQIEEFPTESCEWKKQVTVTSEKFTDCIGKLSPGGQNEIEEIGINVPGTVNQEGDLVCDSNQNWGNVNVRQDFSDYLKTKKIVVESGMNSCAVGEMVFGGGGSDFLWISIGAEVRGAIVANGELVRGSNNYAGEFGHLKVEYDSPQKCACGQYGCLESYSSSTAISKEFEAVVLKDFEFSEQLVGKQFLDDTLKINPYGLGILAREGNPIAINIFNKAGIYLGRAISYGLNISNPKKVYLGGEISEYLDLILPSLLIEMEKCALEECANIEVCRTELGNNASIIGAAAIAVRKKIAQNY